MPIKKTFRVGKDIYDIEEKEVPSFLKDMPSAVELRSYQVGNDIYDIEPKEEAAFLQDFPNAKPYNAEIRGMWRQTFVPPQAPKAEAPKPVKPPKGKTDPVGRINLYNTAKTNIQARIPNMVAQLNELEANGMAEEAAALQEQIAKDSEKLKYFDEAIKGQSKIMAMQQPQTVGNSLSIGAESALGYLTSGVNFLDEFITSLSPIQLNEKALAEIRDIEKGVILKRPSDIIASVGKEKLKSASEQSQAKRETMPFKGGVWDAIKAGDYKSATTNAGSAFLESLPTSLLMLSQPYLVSAGMGQESVDEARKEKGQVTVDDYLAGSLKAGAEFAFENMFGTGRAFKEMVSKLGREAAQQQIEQTVKLGLKEYAKRVGKTLAEEPLSEGATQISQNFIDRLDGKKVGILDNVPDAMLIGMFGGLTQGTATETVSFYLDRRALKEADAKKAKAQKLAEQALEAESPVVAEALEAQAEKENKEADEIVAAQNEVAANADPVLVEELETLNDEIDEIEAVLEQGVEEPEVVAALTAQLEEKQKEAENTLKKVQKSAEEKIKLLQSLKEEENATKERNIEQSNLGEYTGVTEQQQREQEDRLNQEESIAQGKKTPSGGDSVIEGGEKQEKVKPQEDEKVKQEDGQPVLEGVQSLGDEGKGGKDRTKLRSTKKEKEVAAKDTQAGIEEAKPAEIIPEEVQPQLISTQINEGSTIELPPANKYQKDNRRMEFRDGEWQQRVGGEYTKVSKSVQEEAQKAFELSQRETKADVGQEARPSVQVVKRLLKKDFDLKDDALHGLSNDNNDAIGFLNQYPENFLGIEDIGPATKITGITSSGKGSISKVSEYSIQLNFKNDRTKVMHFKSEQAKNSAIDKIYEFTSKYRESNIPPTPEKVEGEKVVEPTPVEEKAGESQVFSVKNKTSEQPELISTQINQDVITKLESLKIDTKGNLNAFGIAPAAWNAIIDTLIGGIKAGRKISELINEAVAKAKSQNPDFDEAGFRAKMEEEGIVDEEVQPEPEPTPEPPKGIKAKNFKDLYDINTKLFGLDRAKATASAVAMDRMIGQMAKRAGISKEEMYDRLEFKKASEKDLPQGVKMQVDAWHGSPYEFDKFTTEAIGTGEGAQAFGWGLYFTDLESIARNYAKQLSALNSKILIGGKEQIMIPDHVLYIVKDILESNGGDVQKTIEDAKDRKDGYADYLDFPQSKRSYDKFDRAIKYLEKNKNKIELVAGRNLYKVSLHKGKSPSEYTWLEWDKPVSKDIVASILSKLNLEKSGLYVDFLKTKEKQEKVNAEIRELEKEGNKIINENKATNEEISKYLNRIRNRKSELKYTETNQKTIDLSSQLNQTRLGSDFVEIVENGLNGGDFYKFLENISPEWKEGVSYDFNDQRGAKWASLFLLENGIDGIKYPAESISRGATSDTARGFNYVVFDENAVSIEEVIKFQKDAEKARGAVMVSMDGQAVIYALSDPNVSTPLHELAHVFEHYLESDEKNVIEEWAGTKGWTIETSEKFARGFEKYLAEGKTETPELKKIFDRFKAWLTDIYNGIVGSEIDVELNEPMRKIYASMLGDNVVNELISTQINRKVSKYFKTIQNNKSLQDLASNLSQEDFEYDVRTVEQDKATATQFLLDNGIEAVYEMFDSGTIENQGLRGSEIVQLSSLLLSSLIKSQSVANQANDLESAQVIRDMQARLTEATRPYLTEAGRTVNAAKSLTEDFSRPETLLPILDNAAAKAKERALKSTILKKGASNTAKNITTTVNSGKEKVSNEVAKMVDEELFGAITKGKKGLSKEQKQKIKGVFDQFKVNPNGTAKASILPIKEVLAALVTPELYNKFVDKVGDLVAEGASLSVAMTQVSTEFIKEKIATPKGMAAARKALSAQVNEAKGKPIKPKTEAQLAKEAAAAELKEATEEFKLQEQLEKERKRAEKLREQEAQAIRDAVDRAALQRARQEVADAEKRVKEIEKKIKDLTKETLSNKELAKQLVDEYLGIANDTNAKAQLVEKVKDKFGITDDIQAGKIADKIISGVKDNITAKLAKKYGETLTKEEKADKAAGRTPQENPLNELARAAALGALTPEAIMDFFKNKYDIAGVGAVQAQRIIDLSLQYSDAPTPQRKAQIAAKIQDELANSSPRTFAELTEQLWYFKVLSPVLTGFLGTGDVNITANLRALKNNVVVMPLTATLKTITEGVENIAKKKTKKSVREAYDSFVSTIKDVSNGYFMAFAQSPVYDDASLKSAERFLSLLKNTKYFDKSITYLRSALSEGTAFAADYEQPFLKPNKSAFDIGDYIALFKRAENGDKKAANHIATIVNALVNAVPRTLGGQDLMFQSVLGNAYLPQLLREKYKKEGLTDKEIDQKIFEDLFSTKEQVEVAKEKAKQNRIKFDLEVKMELSPSGVPVWKLYDRGKYVSVHASEVAANEALDERATKGLNYKRDVIFYSQRYGEDTARAASRIAQEDILSGKVQGGTKYIYNQVMTVVAYFESMSNRISQFAKDLDTAYEWDSPTTLNGAKSMLIKLSAKLAQAAAVLARSINRLFAFIRVGFNFVRDASNYTPLGLARFLRAYYGKHEEGLTKALSHKAVYDEKLTDVEKFRILAKSIFGSASILTASVLIQSLFKSLIDDDDEKTYEGEIAVQKLDEWFRKKTGGKTLPEKVSSFYMNLKKGQAIGSLEWLSPNQRDFYRKTGLFPEYSVYEGVDENGQPKFTSVKNDPAYSFAMAASTYNLMNELGDDKDKVKSTFAFLTNPFTVWKDLSIGQGVGSFFKADMTFEKGYEKISQTMLLDNIELLQPNIIRTIYGYVDGKMRRQDNLFTSIENEGLGQGVQDWTLNRVFPAYLVTGKSGRVVKGMFGEDLYRVPAETQGMVSGFISDYIKSGKNQEEKRMYQWLDINGFRKVWTPSKEAFYLKEDGTPVKLTPKQRDEFGAEAGKLVFDILNGTTVIDDVEQVNNLSLLQDYATLFGERAFADKINNLFNDAFAYVLSKNTNKSIDFGGYFDVKKQDFIESAKKRVEKALLSEDNYRSELKDTDPQLFEEVEKISKSATPELDAIAFVSKSGGDAESLIEQLKMAGALSAQEAKSVMRAMGID